MNICMLKRAFIDVLYEIELDPNFAAFSEVAHIMDDSCQYSHNCGFCSRTNSKLGDDFNKLTNISLTQYLSQQFDLLTNPHYILASTIAGKQKILVFTIDELHLNSKIFTHVQIGVSLHFDNTKEYKAILNSSFCYN